MPNLGNYIFIDQHHFKCTNRFFCFITYLGYIISLEGTSCFIYFKWIISGRLKCEVIFLIRFGLVNTIKTYLIEFVIPNLGPNYFGISETFKTNAFFSGIQK